MADWYRHLTSHPLGARVLTATGLPGAVELRRYSPGDPLVGAPVLVSGAPGGSLHKHAVAALEAAGADVVDPLDRDTDGDAGDDVRYGALIFDATGIASTSDLRTVFQFFSPAVRRLGSSGRVLVLASASPSGVRHATAQRALEGFVRSAGKEMRNGATANLVRVADGAEDGLASALRFFVSGRSAFVSGQAVTLDVTSTAPVEPDSWLRPLDGLTAVVTGAAQGIGAAIADVLARDGAAVIAVDIPAQGQALAAVANRNGGTALQLDITAADAPQILVDHLSARSGGVDLVVHNAGITRDKMLAGMDDARWDAVLDVNLQSQERLTTSLLDEDALRSGGRVVCVSSMSGIAGNRGQTNYATSKAGVIGMVEALAPEMDQRGATINAVAPGFIETAMTAAMPFAVREVARRMSSLNQGGLPVDVAETIAWLAWPATSRINGRTIRVCGQNMIGA